MARINVMNKLGRQCRKKAWETLVYLLILSLIVVALRHFRYRPGRVKVIGYACHKDGTCGGWADRQKGIVGTFVLAAMLGKQFKIHMPRPCELSYYLLPTNTDLDWRLNPGELAGADVTWVPHMNAAGVQFVKDWVKQDDLMEMFGTDYVFFTINMEIVHILRKHRLAQGIRWLQEHTIPEIYRIVLTQLFSLMPGPQALWDNFQQSLPMHTKLICAQIRVGGSGDTESFNTIDHFSGLVAFFAPFNSSSSSGQYRFLFTSDKPYMLEHAHRLFPSLSVSLSGPITHVDRSAGSDVCGGLGRVIVEQRVLGTCHVLVISESGMGKIAAFLRGSDHNLFLFHDGLVESTTRQLSFPNRPSW